MPTNGTTRGPRTTQDGEHDGERRDQQRVGSAGRRGRAPRARAVRDRPDGDASAGRSVHAPGGRGAHDQPAREVDGRARPDVLSFPMDELRPHSMAGPNRSRGRDSDEPEPVLLGDVVLCPQVAAVQARQHGQSTQAELELLTVHGVLHLLGYDHADPEEEAEMFGLQNELLRDWRREFPGRAPSATAPTATGSTAAEPTAT